MNNKPLSLRHVLDKLKVLYGPPPPPKVTNALEMIIWENVAYLADEPKRDVAFRMLRERVGFEPQRILQAPIKLLQEIGRFGIMPELSANKLRHFAQVVITEFAGDFNNVLKLPLKKARQALAKFPGIDEISAERILLFSQTYPVPALEANGVRALLRLGFGKEKKEFPATYRSVQEAIDAGDEFDGLIMGYSLLRQHGLVLCRKIEPLCGQCPLATKCAYFKGLPKEKKPRR